MLSLHVVRKNMCIMYDMYAECEHTQDNAEIIQMSKMPNVAI